MKRIIGGCAGFLALFFVSSVFAAATLPVSNGLVLQLDTSTLSTLTNGNAVSSWNGTNAAAETITFTQTAAASQPTYQSSVASLGGASAVYFDADYMSLDGTLGITGNADRTIFVVWADAVNTEQNFQHAVHMGSAESNKAYGYSVNRKGQTNTVGNHYWATGFNGAKAATSAGNIGMITYNGTTDALVTNGWYGGYNTKTDVNTVAGVTLIGSRLNPTEGGATSKEGIKGSVAEVLIYDRSLSVNEQYQVSQYLSQKYSLTTGYYQTSGTDWTDAQVNIDFDSALPATWGTFVTANCGVIDDGSGSNNIFRLINTTGSLNNQAYNNQLYAGTGSVTGKFDLRFTSATADGVSLVLAGSGVDVSTKITSPNAETPTYAKSFGLGYEIYNKNVVGIYWDGAEIGAIDLGSNGSSYNLKGGQWFTTEFSIDYRAGDAGADVSVTLYSSLTGGLIGTWSDYVSNLTAFDSSLLLRGRTGGSVANADFDNILVKYTDSTHSEFIWTPNGSGSFADATKWEGGVAPGSDSVLKIQSGTNTISDNTLFITNNNSLLVTGGTTTSGGTSAIFGNSAMKVTDATVHLNTIRVGGVTGSGSYQSGQGTSTFSVGAGATVNLARWLSVGFSCDGIAEVDGGTLNLTISSGGGGIILGDRAGSTAKMNLKSGTVNNSGVTNVGAQDGNTAELNISGGTFVGKGAVTVGNGKNTATLKVTGGKFKAGNGVTVKSGAALKLDSASLISSNTDADTESGNVRLGDSSATTNKITVEKGGTFTTTLNLRMGVDSGDYGELVVKGTSTIGGQYIFLGNSGNAKITVDGGTLTAQNVIMGEKTTGNQNAVLEILNGGVAKFSSYLHAGDKPTANATLTLSGTDSQLRVAGDFYVGGDEGGETSVGKLTQTGASFIGTMRFSIQGNTSSSSFINVSKDSYVLVSASAYNTAFDDAYRAAHKAGTIYVGTGTSDVGTFEMADGTTTAGGLVTAAGSKVVLNNTGHYNYVTIDSGTTASPTTMNGDMTIDASLTASIDSGVIVIGYNAFNAQTDPTPILTIGSNAVVTTDRSIRLGRNANSYGEMLVQGSLTQSVDYLLIGYMGEGKVTVDGGTLSSKNTILGDNAGGNCVGTLEVINGGTSSHTRLSIADKSVAEASVLVNGGTLTVSGDTFVGNAGKGTLTIQGASNVTTGKMLVGNTGLGTLTLEGDSKLTTKGDLMIANETGSAGSSITVKGNAVVNVNGEHFIIGRKGQSTSYLKENGTINFNGTGVCGLSENGTDVVFNMEGGTFNVNTTPASYDGYILGKNSVQKQSGGLMNIGTNALAISLKLNGTSTYNLSGGRLNVTGGIDKNGGTLHVTGAGILSANNVNFDFTQEGGTLSPGPNFDGEGLAIGTTNINGNYTAKSGSTIYLEIDAANNTADKLHVTGNSVFETGSKLVLDYDEDLLVVGMSFDLFDFDGTVTNWDGLAASLSTNDLYLWNITANAGVLNFAVNADAIPEPSAWILMLFGVAGLVQFRRARKSK